MIISAFVRSNAASFFSAKVQTKVHQLFDPENGKIGPPNSRETARKPDFSRKRPYFTQKPRNSRLCPGRQKRLLLWRRRRDLTCPAGQAGSRLWSAPGTPFTTAPVQIPECKKEPHPLDEVLSWRRRRDLNPRVLFRHLLP